MNCPKCNTKVNNANINIKTDVAQCQSCYEIFKISENINNEEDQDFDIHNTPDGTWIRKEINHVVIGASTRSYSALFLIPFTLIWSGVSLGGIYGSQIFEEKFNPLTSLFGIPFLIGAIFLCSLTLMAIWGKVEISLDKQGGNIFTGIGTIGKTKTFTWNDISSIRQKSNDKQQASSTIILEGNKKNSFGATLSQDRSYYLYRTLKNIHHKMKENRSFV